MRMNLALLLGTALVSSILARTIVIRAPGAQAGVQTLPARIEFDGGEAGAPGRTPIKFAEEEETDTRKTEASRPKFKPRIVIQAPGAPAGLQTLPARIQFAGSEARRPEAAGRTPIKFAEEEEVETEETEPIVAPRIEMRAPGALAGVQTLPSRIQFAGPGNRARTGGRTPIKFAEEEETEGSSPLRASGPMF